MRGDLARRLARLEARTSSPLTAAERAELARLRDQCTAATTAALAPDAADELVDDLLATWLLGGSASPGERLDVLEERALTAADRQHARECQARFAAMSDQDLDAYLTDQSTSPEQENRCEPARRR